MAIIIDSISFNNEFAPESTSWLLANIGEKITVTIDFTVRADAIPNGPLIGGVGSKTIICNPPGYTDIRHIQTVGFAGFVDFNVGDIIEIEDSAVAGGNDANNPFTVVQKISDSLLILDKDLFHETIISTNDSVHVITPFEAVRYNY